MTFRRAGDLNGNWDGERLAQVVSNLLGNALQHGDEGDAVKVNVNGTESEAVEITVENSGTIPADLLPQLFDPFRGAQRQTGRAEGLGLGLYIVHQIVLAHGGSVDVLSGAETTGPRFYRHDPAPLESRKHLREAVNLGQRVVVHE